MLIFKMHSALVSPSLLNNEFNCFTKTYMERSNLFSSFLALFFLRFVSTRESLWETWIDNLFIMNLLLIFHVKSQSVNFATIAGISNVLIMSLTWNSGNFLIISLAIIYLLSFYDSLWIECSWKLRVFLRPLFGVSSSSDLSFFI